MIINDDTFEYLFSTPLPQAWLMPNKARQVKSECHEMQQLPLDALWSRVVRVNPRNDFEYRLRLQNAVNDYWKCEVCHAY